MDNEDLLSFKLQFIDETEGGDGERKDSIDVSDSKSSKSANMKNESVQRCNQSLIHTCQCRNATCRLNTCHKMKKVLIHTKLCRKRQINCPVCKQLIELCYYHAKRCNQQQCPVPFCSNTRQKLQEKKQNLRADKLAVQPQDNAQDQMEQAQGNKVIYQDPQMRQWSEDQPAQQQSLFQQ
jgi:hypothetical protein